MDCVTARSGKMGVNIYKTWTALSDRDPSELSPRLLPKIDVQLIPDR